MLIIVIHYFADHSRSLFDNFNAKQKGDFDMVYQVHNIADRETGEFFSLYQLYARTYHHASNTPTPIGEAQNISRARDRVGNSIHSLSLSRVHADPIC